MLIKDNFVVDAPIERIWAFILDIPRVSACMPGAQDVRQVEENLYTGKLNTRVGAIQAAFDGRVEVVERIEPERLVAAIRAEDRRLASVVTATFTSQLEPIGTATRIAYEIDLALRGRLAQIGYSSMQQLIRKMTAEFADCLQQSLSAEIN